MEGEQHHYELRSRSRSRSQTPMVLNRTPAELESVEHHYDLRNKSRERSHTPGEVTSSRRSGSRSLPGSAGKMRDQSMETIAERKEERTSESNMDNQSRRSDSSTSTTTKKVERRSERQKAKRQIFVNGQDEAKGETPDDKPEKKRKSVTPRRILTSDYSSEEGEREDPPSRPGSAYEIYKQAGEWWNVFPKTDYTYSQTSQCRYEIAPGVLAMPNMSRRSIHSDGSSTVSSVPSTSPQNLSQSSQATAESGLGDIMDFTGDQTQISVDASNKVLSSTRNSESVPRCTVYKKTHVVEYSSHREKIYTDPGYSGDLRQRFFSWSSGPTKSFDTRKYTHLSQVDSDTELDDAVTLTVHKEANKWRVTEWFHSVFSLVAVTFSRMLEYLRLKKTSSRREYRSSYNYHEYKESRWSKARRIITNLSKYIYLLFVKIIYSDAWLLSRAVSVRNRVKKGPKILCITLLPLLLLAGAYITQKHSFACADLAQCSQWCHETTYRIFNDITNLTSFEYELFAKYITNLKNYSLHYLPSVNVSLPEMPTVGWKITCLLWETGGALARDANGNTLSAESSAMGDNLMPIVSTAHEAIDEREGRTYQKEYLLNISHVLESERRNTAAMWKQFDEKRSTEMNAIREELQKLWVLSTQLKSCCDSRLITEQDLEARVEKVLSSYFGAIDARKDLPRMIEKIVANDVQNDRETMSGTEVYTPSSASEEHIRGIVKEMLKLYDADKTGRVDYALESAGGQIMSTRCTQMYDMKSRAFQLLGFILYNENNDPRTVIQGNPIQPGACWAFQDFPGYLLIKLRSFIYVTGFTIEHAPRSILPNGEMRSAPRKFNVWGLTEENDPDPVMLGDYEFKNSDENLQYFPVQNTQVAVPFEYVELRVHSNHGQLEYTCLYRFRVHGRSV